MREAFEEKSDMPQIMSLDAESVGLMGDIFAIGYVIGSLENREILEEGGWACESGDCAGTIDDHNWVCKNVPILNQNCRNKNEVMSRFVDRMSRFHGYILVDCGYPVETRLLADCRIKAYPVLDLGSMLFAKGLDPIGQYGRKPDELPAHDPLNDASQSLRLFYEHIWWKGVS